LAACQTLPNFVHSKYDNSWSCHQTCGAGSTKIIYTWALDAQGIKFERGVGLKVSGDTNLNYFVIESHYNFKLPLGYSDRQTAYVLKMTRQQLPYQAGVYTLVDNGYIPAKYEKFHIDNACTVKLNYDILPIFYRVHAHSIMNVISGYLIREKEWIELGRYSPKQTQAFYPVYNKNQIIHRGDYLASRCTANSMSRNSTTYTGHLHTDEMCVFYLMFYTDYTGVLIDSFCFRELYEDSPKFSWETKLPGRIPPNSDTLEGVHLVRPECELKKSY
jgi:hypothetical protein